MHILLATFHLFQLVYHPMRHFCQAMIRLPITFFPTYVLRLKAFRIFDATNSISSRMFFSAVEKEENKITAAHSLLEKK